LKRIDIQQLLASGDEGNILSGSVPTVKKSTGALLGDFKETGVEGNG